MKFRTVALILLAAAISFSPLFLLRNTEFAGADAEAEKIITAIDPDYKPWFAGLWTPPSGEIESLLFSLQAAAGSGVIFFILGYFAGRHRSRKKESTLVRS